MGMKYNYDFIRNGKRLNLDDIMNEYVALEESRPDFDIYYKTLKYQSDIIEIDYVGSYDDLDIWKNSTSEKFYVTDQNLKVVDDGNFERVIDYVTEFKVSNALLDIEEKEKPVSLITIHKEPEAIYTGGGVTLAYVPILNGDLVLVVCSDYPEIWSTYKNKLTLEEYEKFDGSTDHSDLCIESDYFIKISNKTYIDAYIKARTLLEKEK